MAGLTLDYSAMEINAGISRTVTSEKRIIALEQSVNLEIAVQISENSSRISQLQSEATDTQLFLGEVNDRSLENEKQRHTHENKPVLDRFDESNGRATFDGEPIGGLTDDDLIIFNEMRVTMGDMRAAIELGLRLDGDSWEQSFDSAGLWLEHTLNGGML